ncbi:DNA repair protein RecN [Phaeocystidibacter marisrubri]|uniref:DNA repair protein RecN n=1 Tax=Phaeocystidibacter marisrubri TaxID=1577780 RepID=A0A6L3ZJM0_9FLAO|nr:DNA repair protein RecN [Phaeocystidibacter marisrubri]KAB2817758.1 DNA repair protein RecN [Phaeocystidibacter marisrubri]GGH73708.1 DNA repair protein RecN [Phaeocystidibacter marisrubri]
MITSLHVRNYALIDELDMQFDKGFSSITGETGAGKSILLGAIGLALGDRADLKSALNADEKCIVELTVKIVGYGMESLFDEHDLDYADETILRREILPSGKSRAFVNDTPTKVTALSAFANRLIDIHSQNDTILLRDPAFQLNLIDGMANNASELKSYKSAYSKWRKAVTDHEQLLQKSTDGLDMDYQRFLLDELVEAKIDNPNEEEVIEEELHRLQHAEDVAESLGNADRVLVESNGLLENIDALMSSLTSGAKYDSRIQSMVERVQSSRIELQDISSEVSSLAEDLESDPHRLQVLDDRMGVLQHLKAKHRASSIEELMELRDDIAVKLDTFERLEEHLAEAQKEVEEAAKERDNAAVKLTQSRKSVLPVVQDHIAELLTRLNMPDARVQLQLAAVEPSGSGVDEMVWLFSANAGRTPQAISKIASGGELSRVMLALKALMSKVKGLPTIIFDEIDTGISGETAKRVAEILREMGSNMQVLAITHLPQIAAAGQAHYLVEKQVNAGATRTHIRQLNPDERIEEVSRILSGKEATEAARANAKELLAND